MAHIIENRILEQSTTAGLGAFTLAGASLGYRAFASVCTVADTVPYYIEAIDSLGKPSGAYEYGIGTYSGANTLTRTTVYGSSNAGAKVDFAAGTKLVGIGDLAPYSGAISYRDGADSSTWLWARTLTGAHTIGAGPLNGYTSAYHFDIYSDNADVGTDFMVGFRVRHQFGGAATKGGREALSGTGWLTAATNAANANRNYVAVQGKMLAQSGDGGTNTGAGALGAVFGIGGAAYAYAAATNLLGIEGGEFNTFTEAGSSAKHMAGVSIVGCQATRGAVIDAAIRIGAQGAVGVFGPHGGWKHGIVFTDENGADPFYASSTLIGSQFQVVKTIAAGIDLAGFTMTSYILRGIYSKLTELSLTLGDSGGNALIEVNGASTNGNLILAPKNTGVVSTGVNGYAISGIKVVGARDTGWSAMTGSSDKATVYATGSVTLAQLAGRVMALQAALTTHGLIGA